MIRQNKHMEVGLSSLIKDKLRLYFLMLDGQPPASDFYTHIIREVEQPLIELALEVTGGHKLQAAELLGINRNTLRKKMKELNILDAS
jgi:two-component system nitrogen regulation response regulator GlnG